jgi:hypothetical protein
MTPLVPFCGVSMPISAIGGDPIMKALASILALSLVVAFTAPAFAAGTPKNEAACKKAGMQWDATAKKCSKGM